MAATFMVKMLLEGRWGVQLPKKNNHSQKVEKYGSLDLTSLNSSFMKSLDMQFKASFLF